MNALYNCTFVLVLHDKKWYWNIWRTYLIVMRIMLQCKTNHLKGENLGKIHFLFLGSKTDQRCSVRFTAPSHVCRDVHCGKIKTSVTRLCHPARNKPRESFLRGFPDTSHEVQLWWSVLNESIMFSSIKKQKD